MTTKAQGIIDGLQLAGLLAGAGAILLLVINPNKVKGIPGLEQLKQMIDDAVNPFPELKEWAAGKWEEATTFSVDSARWYAFLDDLRAAKQVAIDFLHDTARPGGENLIAPTMGQSDFTADDLAAGSATR